jgi:sugar phosphate isomerase/epimerase
MRVSTSTGLINDKSLSMIDKIQAMHVAGFKVLDLSLFDCIEEGNPFASPNYKEWAYELKEFCSSIDVVFSQCHSPIYNYYKDDEQTKFLRKLGLRSLEVCGILEIPWCVFHTTNIPSGDYSQDNKKVIRELNIKHFKELCAIASDYNTGICCENLCDMYSKDGFNHSYCTNAEEIMYFLEAVDSEHLGICLDTGHAHIMNNDISDMVRTFGANLRATHIHDAFPPLDTHLPPFLGTIEWKPIIEALIEIGYQGDFTFETSYVRKLPESLQSDAISFLYRLGTEMINLV